MATFDKDAFYKRLRVSQVSYFKYPDGPFYTRLNVSQVRQSQMISLPSESCIDR